MQLALKVEACALKDYFVEESKVSYSGRAISKANRVSLRFIAVLIIAMIALPLSPSQAEVAGRYVRQAAAKINTSQRNRTRRRMPGGSLIFASARDGLRLMLEKPTHSWQCRLAAIMKPFRA